MMLQRADESRSIQYGRNMMLVQPGMHPRLLWLDDKSFLKLKAHQAACSTYLCICVSLCLINDKNCCVALLK